MTAISDWGTAFLTAISNALMKIFGFLPDLIGALIILWIGWIIAGILAKIVADVLRKVRFNQAADKAGLSRFVQAAGVRQDASGVLGEIVKWFFRVIALIAAFSVLQLPALTLALTGILDFIPNLFIALVIVLIGGLVANFVADFVKGATSTGGFQNGNMLANVARYAILYVAVIAALGQIGIAATVINTIFIGTIAALALAIGLAFGLGGRDVASQIWQNTYQSAQQNLPKLGSGMQRQAQQTKQRAQQTVQPQAGYVQPMPMTYAASQPPTQGGYGNQYPTQQPPAQDGYNNQYPTQQPPTQGGYGNQYPTQQPPTQGGYYDQGGNGNYPRS